jgi:hypothetical protein
VTKGTYPTPPNTNTNKVPSTAYTYEITINYKNPEDLEHAIKERVKRLLNADIVDVSPIGVDLDEQLGIAEIPEPPESALMQELNDDDGPRSS